MALQPGAVLRIRRYLSIPSSGVLRNIGTLWHATNAPSVFASSELDPFYDAAEPVWSSAGRRLFQSVPRYVSPAELNYKLPDQHVAEFAFVGRSNVGKSSLISALIGHEHKLIKVSKTPGATRNINYFALGKELVSKPDLYLVDLPGYGFAKASKSETGRWKDFIQGYLRDRNLSVLRRVFVLVDSRHGLKESDADMMTMLDSLALPYEIVLTKADASSKQEMAAALDSVFKRMMRSKAKVTSGLPYVHAVSSNDGSGLLQLQACVAEVLSHNWNPRSPANAAASVKLAQELITNNPGIEDSDNWDEIEVEKNLTKR